MATFHNQRINSHFVPRCQIQFHHHRRSTLYFHLSRSCHRFHIVRCRDGNSNSTALNISITSNKRTDHTYNSRSSAKPGRRSRKPPKQKIWQAGPTVSAQPPPAGKNRGWQSGCTEKVPFSHAEFRGILSRLQNMMRRKQGFGYERYVKGTCAGTKTQKCRNAKKAWILLEVDAGTGGVCGELEKNWRSFIHSV